MHPTAILPMRSYCVDARPFGATKKEKMKLLITILLILNCGIANSQNYNIGDSLFVNANGGLNLREEANTNSNKIGLLNFGERVFIKSKLGNNKQIKIGLISGNWVEIRTDKYEGSVSYTHLTLPTICSV